MRAKKVNWQANKNKDNHNKIFTVIKIMEGYSTRSNYNKWQVQVIQTSNINNNKVIIKARKVVGISLKLLQTEATVQDTINKFKSSQSMINWRKSWTIEIRI